MYYKNRKVIRKSGLLIDCATETEKDEVKKQGG